MKKPSEKKLTRFASPAGRPPIVAVLGHIDHGKSSLLDKIRQTNVVATETGGITQHIGAYQASFTLRPTPHNPQPTPKLITFIDTPGHAAFSQMRSRGANVADLVVLVVAADEGFKPQTKESLKHIEAAKVPYLVAINKTDLPNIDVNQIKKDLVKNGILVEGYGGEIVTVPVSAKTGKGVDELLEMILLLAEMAELKADSQGKLEAVVVESKLDRARGALAAILVRNGSLKVRDEIKVDNVGAKIRAMFDENGRKVDIAGPSKAVEVLGFEKLPPVGGVITEVTEKKSSVPSKTSVPARPTGGPSVIRKTSETEPKAPEDTEGKLKIVLKSDVAGTLEAILASLPENVEVISSGVGDVTESDVLLASATGAEIIGFSVKIPRAVKKLTQVEKVKIKTYQVIYELLEEVEERVLKIIEPTIDEGILGQAEIIAEFEVKKQRIAGCKVYEGRIDKKDRLHLKREKKVIGDSRIKSMRRGKESISQAKKGDEFGVILDPPLDFKIGDVLVSYRKVKE